MLRILLNNLNLFRVISSISRSSNNKNDLVCNIGGFISTKDIESIVSQIKKKLIFKKTIFILFAWCGVPRMIANKDYIWSTTMHIVQNFLNITTYLNPSRIIFLSSAGALYPENLNHISSLRRIFHFHILTMADKN